MVYCEEYNNMITTHPYFGMNVSYFKYDRKTNTLIDNTPKTYRVTPYHSCREEVSQEFANYSKRLGFKIVPLPVKMTDEKIYTTSGTIILETEHSGHYTLFKHSDAKTTLKKVFNYILGISGVCLSHTNQELLRRQNNKNTLANSISFRGSTSRITNKYFIYYKTLSPFWISSSPLMSLFLGLARNCYSMSLDGSIDLEENLFSKVNYDTVIKTINTVDFVKAKEIYNKVIVPFYDYLESNDDSDELMLNSDCREDFEYLMNKGCHNVFSPYDTTKYWKDSDDPYHNGWYWYCDYVCE